MKDIKYILKRVFIGILIGLGIMFFKDSFLTASALSYSLDTLYLDNAGIYQEVWYERPVDTGFNMKLIGVADTNINTNLYAQILICAGPSNNSVIWVPGDQPNSWSGTQRNVTVNNTNVPCKVGTTSGKVQQVLFTTRTYDGDISATVRMSYKDGYTGFTFVSYGLSDKPWSYIQSVADYQNALSNINGILNTINSTMSTIGGNLQNAIINSSNEQNAFIKKVEDAVKAMHETLGNDDIDNNPSQFNEFNNYVAQNGVITNLITMPVTLFTKVLDTVDGTCVDYNLGSLYDTDLILPCIDVSDYLGSTLWGVIDVIISGLLVYAISRHFVKVFNKMSSLEESDIID